MYKPRCQTPSSSDEIIALNTFERRSGGSCCNSTLAKNPSIAVSGRLPLTNLRTELSTSLSNFNIPFYPRDCIASVKLRFAINSQAASLISSSAEFSSFVYSESNSLQCCQAPAVTILSLMLSEVELRLVKAIKPSYISS